MALREGDPLSDWGSSSVPSMDENGLEKQHGRFKAGRGDHRTHLWQRQKRDIAPIGNPKPVKFLFGKPCFLHQAKPDFEKALV